MKRYWWVEGVKKAASIYVQKWWIPSLLVIFLLGLFALSEGFISRFVSLGTGTPIFILTIIALLGILAAGIYQITQKQWGKGFINLASFIILLIAFGVTALMMLLVGPDKDDFGKDIVIPPNMVTEEPKKDSPAINGEYVQDAEREEILKIFSKGSEQPNDPVLSVDIPVLNEFSGPNRQVLLRYLASNPKWFLTRDEGRLNGFLYLNKEKGKLYACRRFIVEEQWRSSLHGYYSAHDFDSHFDSRTGNHFQFRITLGIDGPITDKSGDDRTTYALEGLQPVSLKVTEARISSQGMESWLILQSKGAALEIFEQSWNRKRPFTPWALQQIKTELNAVLASKVTYQQGLDRALLPSGAIKNGRPNIYLMDGHCGGGIYQVYANVNPGESGHVYLKVFEATKNTPLSTARIPGRSTEYIGWSDNPNEQFFYNTEITVYEGDWGVYYPARFELWFVPDSGRPERKLIEKIFKIEGWQR